MALLTLVVAAPFTNPDMSRAATRIQLVAPDQVHTDIGKFTNLIPFATTDRPMAWAVRRFQPPFPLPGSINLFTNPIPLTRFDASSIWRVSDFLPPSQPYNANLYSTIIAAAPFSKADWSSTFRMPDFLPASQPYNNLIYSEVPFSQYDWSVQQGRTRYQPIQPYNAALLSGVVQAPFSQMVWTAASFPASRVDQGSRNALIYSEVPLTRFDSPPSRSPVNRVVSTPGQLSLLLTAVPFNQSDWPSARTLRSTQVLPQPYNVNIYAPPVPSTTSPFAMYDWSRSWSPALTPLSPTAYNINLFHITSMVCSPRTVVLSSENRSITLEYEDRVIILGDKS